MNSEMNEEFYIENVFASGRIEQIPPNIEVGDNVKVVLRLNTPVDGIDAERLWFRVVELNDDFTILVELDNDPLFIKRIEGSDRLLITRQNILEVLKAD